MLACCLERLQSPRLVWNPPAHVVLLPLAPCPQALSHALRVGSPDKLRVYRLYCRGTCEERLLQLSDRLKALDTLCQQSHGR